MRNTVENHEKQKWLFKISLPNDIIKTTIVLHIRKTV